MAWHGNGGDLLEPTGPTVYKDLRASGYCRGLDDHVNVGPVSLIGDVKD